MNEPLLKNKEMKQLYKAVLKLKTEQEVMNFLRDLCTLSELEVMAERLEVAKEIVAKKPYRTISERTGSSTATITRIAYWLHHGKGGYQTVLDRLRS